MLFPKPGSGFQEIVSTQAAGSKGEINSHSFLEGHQMALSDHLTGGWDGR